MKTRMNADRRKDNIVSVACRIANENGLINVSYLTIEPHCANISARGIRYHFPNKKALYQAMLVSDEMTIKTMTDAVRIGLLKDDGNGNLSA